MKEIPIGRDNFKDIRVRNCLYVDKTPFIREVLSGSQVLLLPRPRRFGKTLNMTMLHCFFDMTQRSRDLFEGLAITHDPEAMTHLNGYPTIFLSLKELSQIRAWAPALVHLQSLITELYRTARPLLADLVLDKEEQAYFDGVFEPGFTAQPVARSLARLMHWLYRATGKKVVLLIDEYDAPLHGAFENNYYDEAVSFFRIFFSEALKGSLFLERAVVTGILRVAKESIFSGLNNLEVCTILHEPFSTCFGFTEAEVETLMTQAGSRHDMDQIRKWYNGYCFGKTTIYNPWSILNMLKQGGAALDAHWVNTSGNDLIRQQVQKGGCNLIQLETLLRGGRISAKLTSNLALRDMTLEITWSLFLFAGYLTAENYNPSKQTADLYIPNYEVQRFFNDTVQAWLGSFNHSNELINALLEGKLELFALRLQETIVTILSYHDTAAKAPEKVFHMFILGLLAHLADRYQVLSNRESGHGRTDLHLIAKRPGQPGFLFEFKAAAAPDAETLRAAADAALQQAASRDYAAPFRQAEVTTLYTLGLASHGKHLALASRVQTLPDGPPSEPTYFLSDPDLKRQPKRRKKPAKQPNLSLEGEVAQKIALAAQIQLVQRQRGVPELKRERLMALTLDQLQAMALGLGID